MDIYNACKHSVVFLNLNGVPCREMLLSGEHIYYHDVSLILIGIISFNMIVSLSSSHNG